jgi:hypothetical protein
MEIIAKNFELLTRSDFLAKLHGNYWSQGTYEENWMGKPGAQYLKVKTGMMQGILHYTSSLLHGIKILFMKDYISRKMRFNSNKTTKEENEERKVIITSAVSSDDSSFKISFEFGNPKDAVRANITLLICFKFGSRFGEILEIYDSVKTTRLLAMVGEFNSE